jgi:hypothetical protein
MRQAVFGLFSKGLLWNNRKQIDNYISVFNAKTTPQ